MAAAVQRFSFSSTCALFFSYLYRIQRYPGMYMIMIKCSRCPIKIRAVSLKTQRKLNYIQLLNRTKSDFGQVMVTRRHCHKWISCLCICIVASCNSDISVQIIYWIGLFSGLSTPDSVAGGEALFGFKEATEVWLLIVLLCNNKELEYSLHPISFDNTVGTRSPWLPF